MSIIPKLALPKVLGIMKDPKTLRVLADIVADLQLKFVNKFLTLAEEKQKVLKIET